MIFRNFEQKIIKDINESGMSIDAIYFIMRSIMQEIEEKYSEYCRMEDIENTKKELKENKEEDEEFNFKNESSNSTNEEGTN